MKSIKVQLLEIKIIEIFSSFLHREVVDSRKSRLRKLTKKKKEMQNKKKKEFEHPHLLQK